MARLPSDPSTAALLPVPAEVDRTDPGAIARALVTTPIERPTVAFVLDDGSVRGETLSGSCVVIDLLGHPPTAQVRMVGLVAPAAVTNQRDGGSWTGTVAHLLTRTGVSVTAVGHGVDVTVFGPDAAPQTGRVPDACRRLFGLPTPAPETTMTPFVFGAWLEVIGGRAEDEPLDWPTIVAWHPAAASLSPTPTPAELAAATRELGESMDWDRFRRVIASVGGFPFGPDGIEVARRADAGMFSRWAMDELPLAVDALGHLASLLTAGAHDRIWAAAHLCGAVPVDGTADVSNQTSNAD